MTGGVRSKQKLSHGRPWVWDFISSPLRSHWSAGFGHISRAAFVGISPASPGGVECVAVARSQETCELLTVSLGRGGLRWQRRRR